jgi:hypothetical protein
MREAGRKQPLEQTDTSTILRFPFFPEVPSRIVVPSTSTEKFFKKALMGGGISLA